MKTEQYAHDASLNRPVSIVGARSVVVKPGQMACVQGLDAVFVADVYAGVVVIISDGTGVVAVAAPVLYRGKASRDKESSALLDRCLQELGSLQRARAALIGLAHDGRSRLLPNRVRLLLQARRIPIVFEALDGRFSSLHVYGFGLVSDAAQSLTAPLNAARVPRRQACRADDLRSGITPDEA